MAVNPLIRVTNGVAPVHGDEVDSPMLRNPYSDQQAVDYENGYERAQQLGHWTIGNATPQDIMSWQGQSPAWREGFQLAASRLGLANVAQKIGPMKEAAFPATEYFKTRK